MNFPKYDKFSEDFKMALGMNPGPFRNNAISDILFNTTSINVSGDLNVLRYSNYQYINVYLVFIDNSTIITTLSLLPISIINEIKKSDKLIREVK